MLAFSFKSLSFKQPLVQRTQFLIKIELAEGSPQATETVPYFPRNNIAIFSETLEFFVRNPQENTYFHLEIDELVEKTQEKQRICRETFHINKMPPNKSKELVIPTVYGTNATVEFTLELSPEFKGVIEEQNSPLSKGQAQRREKALNIDRFNPLKMGPLMYEFVFALTPLVFLKANAIDFFTWKNPSYTFIISLGLSFFLLYHQMLLGFGFLGFFVFNRKIIPIIMQAKPIKDDVKGGFNIYKRNLEMMRELMQITVWVDELQNKLFNNPDKTLLLHLLLTIKKYALALGILFLVGNMTYIILIGYWAFLCYFTQPGKKLIETSYVLFTVTMDRIDSILLPALKIEDKIFAGQLQARKNLSNPAKTSSPEAQSPTKTSSPVLAPSQKIINQKIFVVYENQRWWLIKGWCSKLYSDERGPWSDDLGKLPISKESFRLPGPNWKWESDWMVVKGASTDKEGWEYADSFKVFHKEGSSKGLVNLVRRRKWIRRCIEVKE